MFQAIRSVIHSFSTGLKHVILTSTVVSAVGVENRPQTLTSTKRILQFVDKNAVLAVVFKEPTHQ